MDLMSGGGTLSASPRGVRGVLGTSFIEAILRAFFKSRALDFGVGDWFAGRFKFLAGGAPLESAGKDAQRVSL